MPLNPFRMRRLQLAGALSLACLTTLALTSPTAIANDGGTGTSGSSRTVKGDKAKLVHGKAIAPKSAPGRVKRVIDAANEIAKGKGYCWGGGHASFRDNCYDCSGAVSYMLHGAGLLASPLPSGPLMAWGAPGRGAWISVYANRGHAYAVVAGLRWDTSAVGERLNRGSGPRWRATKRSPRGYAVRHYVGY